MLKDLDPDVEATIRRVNDRFIRLGKGTPQHEVRAKLGPKRHDLDRLVREHVLRTIAENYLPRIKALSFLDEEIRYRCLQYTKFALNALKWLYADSGPGNFTLSHIQKMIELRIAPHPEIELIRVGALLALDIETLFQSFSVSPEGILMEVRVKEAILDFDDFDDFWAKQQQVWQDRAAYGEADPPMGPGPIHGTNPKEERVALDFSFVRDSDLKRICERDFTELQKIGPAQVEKCRLILTGGLIEGLLLDALLSDESRAQNSPKAGRFKGKELDEWPLSVLIDVAVDLGFIKPTTENFSKAVKDLRNLVHPGKEKREKITFDEREANIAQEVLGIVIRDLKNRSTAGGP